MNNLTQSNTLKMSSREIAELTGKRHDHVKRDVVVMLEGLNLDAPNFGEIYIDSQNRQQIEYRLDKELTLCLVSGYSVKLRMGIIKRWQELESHQSPQLPQTFSEALQLAADQAKQIEAAAPKVAFVDNLVERNTLMTASQVAQKYKKSAIWLNKILLELSVYNSAVKRSKVFQQWFVDKGYGEMKQTTLGYSQALFTPSGEVWIAESLYSEGII